MTKHPLKSGEEGENLDQRAVDVLMDVVRQFVQEGRPVGSRILSRRGCQPLSPATLRNAMSDLEEEGYLYQPHTSAGRVPTDKGYRFFVNRLMGDIRSGGAEEGAAPEALEGDRRRLLDGLHDLDELFTRASRLLAEKTRQVGLVIPPVLRDAQIQHMEFLPVGGDKILVIMVTRSGLVQNKLVRSPEVYAPGELALMNRLLQERCSGLTLAQIRESLLKWMAEDRASYDAVLRRALELGRRCLEDEDADSSPGGLRVEGAANLLGQPGALEAEELLNLFAAFESKHRLVNLLTLCLQEGGLTVLIGSEIPDEQIAHCSLVLASYSSPRGEQGVLGVVGPTRMEYRRVIRAVDETARAVMGIMEEK
jgi:heat-inducible transcriptional repressor